MFLFGASSAARRGTLCLVTVAASLATGISLDVLRHEGAPTNQRVFLLLPTQFTGVPSAPVAPRDEMFSSGGGSMTTEKTLFNFTTVTDLDKWVESSDGTAREVGMSTGSFKLQKTARFQRAVFFSLLNPQPNGAGFVGYYTNGQWDLSAFSTLRMRCRAQGENYKYKIYLKHHNESTSGGTGSYESYFELPSDKNFTTVEVPLDSFAFYYRGRLMPDAPPLDVSDITLFGVQIYGGVYAEEKQSGVSSLEIDWISAA